MVCCYPSMNTTFSQIYISRWRVTLIREGYRALKKDSLHIMQGRYLLFCILFTVYCISLLALMQVKAYIYFSMQTSATCNAAMNSGPWNFMELEAAHGAVNGCGLPYPPLMYINHHFCIFCTAENIFSFNEMLTICNVYIF